MSFDDFDFSSLAPNSKRNLIYSCLGFSMGFLLKEYFIKFYENLAFIVVSPNSIEWSSDATSRVNLFRTTLKNSLPMTSFNAGGASIVSNSTEEPSVFLASSLAKPYKLLLRPLLVRSECESSKWEIWL